MAEKSVEYRLNVYRSFAEAAKRNGLKWVVAHGCEGYPQTIGRDLDVLCCSKSDIIKAAHLFSDIAKENSKTKWIIEPHPIWGKRVLAISENYEVAELHILYKLNSGLLDCPVNWESVSADLFPSSPEVAYFKSVVMPLLGGSAKLDRLTKDTISGLNYSLRRIYNKMINKRKITGFDKMFAYLQMGGVIL